MTLMSSHWVSKVMHFLRGEGVDRESGMRSLAMCNVSFAVAKAIQAVA